MVGQFNILFLVEQFKILILVEQFEGNQASSVAESDQLGEAVNCLHLFIPSPTHRKVLLFYQSLPLTHGRVFILLYRHNDNLLLNGCNFQNTLTNDFFLSPDRLFNTMSTPCQSA